MMRTARATALLALLLLFGAVAVGAQQAQEPQQQGNQQGQAGQNQADAAGQTDAAQEQAAEPLEPGDYQGEWRLPLGPIRLQWNLQAEQYEFYVYQGESVRIGSRGTIAQDGNRLTFTAQEITQDGEQWNPIQLTDEEASQTFYAIVQDDILRMADPRYTQFYNEYYRPDAVPQQTEGAGQQGDAGAGQGGGYGGGAEGGTGGTGGLPGGGETQ
jgi:hypothetical protein